MAYTGVLIQVGFQLKKNYRTAVKIFKTAVKLLLKTGNSRKINDQKWDFDQVGSQLKKNYRTAGKYLITAVKLLLKYLKLYNLKQSDKPDLAQLELELGMS